MQPFSNRYKAFAEQFTASCSSIIPTPMQPNTKCSRSRDASTSDFCILKINCSGLRHKIDDILHFMDKENIIQVLKFKFTIIALVRMARESGSGGGGGLGFLVKRQIQVQDHQTSCFTKHTQLMPSQGWNSKRSPFKRNKINH